MNKKAPKPFVDFILTQKCNYRCEYCSQSKKINENNLNNAKDGVVKAFLNFTKKLPEDFEITLTGGEPLLHPKFFEILAELKKQNKKVVVFSNFSSPIDKYKKIIDILKDNLAGFYFSCHSAQCKNIDDFINKTLIINSYKPKNTEIRVVMPLWQNNTGEIKYIKNKIKGHNISFEIQHVRIKNEFWKYNKDEQKILAKDKNAADTTMVTFGTYCNAGCLSAVIYETGEVYRCYSSRFIKTHYLGNIKDKNFKLWDKIRVCPLLKCTCPKPFKYNMLTDKKNYFPAFFSLLNNAFGAFGLLIKNRKILAAKFKQSKLINKK